jgi:hypothetical protein
VHFARTAPEAFARIIGCLLLRVGRCKSWFDAWSLKLFSAKEEETCDCQGLKEGKKASGEKLPALFLVATPPRQGVYT